MNQYGSDKGAYHGYTEIYESILASKKQNLRYILEIGIGTNNPSLPSSMGVNGKPGASLRAWRDYAPNAQVFGMDAVITSPGSVDMYSPKLNRKIKQK